MRTFRATTHAIGLVATATQVGYALGMLAFIPLGDFVERRALVIVLFIATGLALIGAAASPSLVVLIITSFLIGFFTVIPQIMIPLAAELSAPEQQGKTIGTVLSGVLLGILLARTFSGIIAEHFGWRSVYWIAAAASFAFAILLRSRLPVVPSASEITYPKLIHSIWRLVVDVPKLRQISLVAAMFFCAFSAFWTTLVFLLEHPPYHYGSEAAGLFGLVGATGAFVAPLAGRMSDRHSPRFVVVHAILGVIGSYLLFWILGWHLWGLVLGVILLDASVQGAQVANQSRVLSLRPDARNRVNTVYMICYFSGGSIGSLLGSFAWSRWGWHGVCALGILTMLLAGAAFLWKVPDPVPDFQIAD
ncbi:MAG TPA: MFS transporter, partial [Terriglobales bacterium]|nr:MFS transporter [Terriglobales bacterium]